MSADGDADNGGDDDVDGDEINVGWIKAEARRRKCRVTALLALSEQNDPFYSDQKYKLERAAWFGEQWGRFGFGEGVHIRRLHYRMISDEAPPKMPDGTVYQNTDKCYQWMGDACCHARHLGVVDPLDFEDRRNPGLQGFGMPHETVDDDPSCVADPGEGDLPTISTNLSSDLDCLEIDNPTVSGYGYAHADQPYLLEVWIEKSTMNDILVPLCERLHVNFVCSVGFQSITAAVNLIRRAREAGKPLRAWWISDFDPAGEKMPVATARQVEYHIQRVAPDVDIKIRQLALTREQVVHYDLPRIPIKDSDLRKGKFEDRRGEGAVELDALEAVHPGELARMVQEAVGPYIDQELEDRFQEAEEEAQNLADQEWAEAVSPYRNELEQIREEARPIYDRYQEELRQIKDRLDAELAPLLERLEVVWHATREVAETFDPNIPGRPEPDVDPDAEYDDDQWLYSSDRDYWDQLEAYRCHLDKVDEEIPQKQCGHCGESFKAGRGRAKFCSPGCCKAYHGAHPNPGKVAGEVFQKVCDHCGVPFETVQSRKRFCGTRCRNAYHQSRE